MIVIEVSGDAGDEFEEYDPQIHTGAADLLDIPEALWRAYVAAQAQVRDLGDTIEIVGRSVGLDDLDLVDNAAHLVSHHGYNEPMVFRADLADLKREHDQAWPSDARVPHAHSGVVD